MKKIILFIIFFFLFGISYAIITPGNLGEELYKILQNDNLTKKEAVEYFCKKMYSYIDENNHIVGYKSVFLKILCNETGIYSKEFAKNIKLKDSVKKFYSKIGENKRTSLIGYKCWISGLDGKENSLNNWDFACIAKDIFDKLENDIFNIATFSVLGGDLDDELELTEWQKDIFGDKICKNGKYLNSEGDKNNVCNHKQTFKYLKDNISGLRSTIKNNLSFFKLKGNYSNLYSFIQSYIYDPNQVLISLKNISYDELYFYNLFLAYYSEVVQKSYGTLQVVGVSDNPYDVFGKINYKEINEANSYINLSQAVVNKTWLTLTQLMWTYPIHIGFLAIQEDLKDFMQALARIYTPLDQLRYKLINNQDLDRE